MTRINWETREKIKGFLKASFTILFLVTFVFLVYQAFEGARLSSEKKSREREAWIDNCVNSGGRIDTVGSPWTSQYFVCYPREGAK